MKKGFQVLSLLDLHPSFKIFKQSVYGSIPDLMSTGVHFCLSFGKVQVLCGMSLPMFCMAASVQGAPPVN